MQKNVKSLMILAVLVSACATEPPLGLGPAALPGEVPGPTANWLPLLRPQPDIPFPNDIMLSVGADGAHRWNVSRESATQNEKTLRTHLDAIEGFSGLTPISVAFDAPIDVSTVTDSTVFVVNIQAQSPISPDKPNPRYGEVVPLDLGRGWFPHKADPHQYLPLDPYQAYDSYVLPPDNKVDTDGDGVADKWLYFYEVATHTLDIRPILPLQSGAQYAVVLTRGIKGWSKSGDYGPIRAPWPYVNHDSQTDNLRRALPFLVKQGVELKDIALAWTLTTGDLSRTFRALRDGLYGTGAFAWLAKEFPPVFHEIDDLGITADGDGSWPASAPNPVVPGDSLYTLQGAFMKPIIGLINNFAPDVGAGGVDHISHFVFGTYDTVNLRATPDNVWRIDVRSGQVDVDPALFHERVPFMLVVPKTTANHKPPFPVDIHAHATGTSRVEALLLADHLAEAGIATFSIDAVGHGPILPDALKTIAQKGSSYIPLVRAALGALLFPNTADKEFPESMSDTDALKKMMKNGFVQELVVKGRATDDNGDCLIEAGEAYYAPDAFRLRDAMRQTTLDYITGIRVLHAMDAKTVPPKPTFDPHTATPEQLMPHLLAGDFDMDGVLDVGGAIGQDGKQQSYFMTGVSLGGIHTALTAPLEPLIVAATPIVPGAGLADIFIRTRLHDKVTGLVIALSGPMLVGCPAGLDAKGNTLVDLSWNNESDGCSQKTKQTWKDPQTGVCLDAQVTQSVVLATLTVAPGSQVVLHNQGNSGTAQTVAAADGSFRIALPSDKGDFFDLQVLSPDGHLVHRQALQTPFLGLAKQRNTPEFRQFVQLAANILEGADAITVADRMFLDPLPGHARTNLLAMVAVGDMTVPFAQGLALARTMGLFGRDNLMNMATAAIPAPYRSFMQAAIDSGLLTGQDVPPPLLDPSKPEGGDGLCHLLNTDPAPAAGEDPGISGICLANVHGHHEYIAQPAADDSFPKDNGYKGTYTEMHRNLLVTYLHSLGRHVIQDPCWGDANCVKDKDLKKEWALPIGQSK